MKNKCGEPEVNHLSVIITTRSNVEKEIIQKQGQAQSQTTMAGDNLITCNTQLAKSFNILKNPFDKESPGTYYKKILATNYKNNSKDTSEITDIPNDSIIDPTNNQLENHKNINIHENDFFYDVIKPNLNSSHSKHKDKRDFVPGTLNVKTCKHINQCTCNQAPVPLTEALQNISLAYNPITKQLHFSSPPGTSPKHHNIKKNDNISTRYFLNDVDRRESATNISKNTEDCTSMHSFEDVYDQNLISNGFSDGTQSSISEHSDIVESLIIETPSDINTDIQTNAEDLCLGSADVNKVGFAGFLSRAVSTIVGDGAQSKGWKLWSGRAMPEQKYSHVVASSTALIQHIRPPTLPAKDSAEESRHRAEYQRMLMEARQKEQRERDFKKTQLQSRTKREEAQAQRVKLWQEILPKFSHLRSLPQTRSLWWHGLPPCTRGRIWILAIGNSINVTHDDYLSCVQNARTKISIKRGLTIESSFPVDSGRIYELFAIDGKSIKTTKSSDKHTESIENSSALSKSLKDLKSQINVKHNSSSNSKSNVNYKPSNVSNNVSLAYLNFMQSEISAVSHDLANSTSDDVSIDEDACLDVIQLDISRTFPSLGVFQHGGPYYPILHALLAAYVTYKPEVGYVQGMSFLAAILILNMEPEDAFICFCNILEKPLHRAAFSLDQREMRAYFRAYDDLLRNNLPLLHGHFLELGLSSDLYCVDWLYAAFSRAMPLDIACRVWDLFVRDGESFLFRTAVGVLHLYQSELLEMDFIAAAQFLTRLPDTLSPERLFRSIRQVNMTHNKTSFVHLVETYKGHV